MNGIRLAIVFAALASGGIASAAEAAYVDLSSAILNGNATATSNQIVLSNRSGTSSAYLPGQISTNQNFNLSFSFDMSQYGAIMADGISFIIQSSGANALGESGGGLGAKGIDDSAGVAFRSFIYNQAEIFTDGNILTPVQQSDFALSTLPAVEGVNYNANVDVNVAYNADSHSLSYSALNNTTQQSVSGSAITDLSFLLGQTAYIGFTGATGYSSGFQAIRDVSLQAVPAVPESSTWVMLIAGFGAIGAVMRRSRRSKLDINEKLGVPAAA